MGRCWGQCEHRRDGGQGGSNHYLYLARRAFPELTMRTASTLYRKWWHSVAAVMESSDDDLLDTTMIGPKMVAEIRAVYPYHVLPRRFDRGISTDEQMIQELREVGAA